MSAEGEPRGDRAVNARLLRTAWPLVVAMLGETVMGVVDTKIVGGLGPVALGGVALGTTIMWLTYAGVHGLMRGVNVQVSHAIGRGVRAEAAAFASAGATMGALAGVVIALACRDLSAPLRWIGIEEAMVPVASEFVAAVTLAAPANGALIALIQHRQAVGEVRAVMAVGITGNAINAVLAWALVYGHLGLPSLGVAGAGYATGLSETICLAILGWLLLRERRRAPRGSRLSLGAAMKDVARVGVPAAIERGGETMAFATFNTVLGSIAAAEIAGHQITLTVMRVSFLPGLALCEATTVLVGQALGARSLARADQVVRSGVLLAFAFMGTCGVAFAKFGGQLAAWFTADPEVAAVATKLLLAAALLQLVDAPKVVLSGALRGAKDTRAIALIGVVSIWTFVPTASLVLGKTLGLGALGGWIGLITHTVVGATLYRWRWRRGGWRQAYRDAARAAPAGSS
ncbi:MAG: MATE family efflux transporter [Kofleriaceae bacterium]